MHIFIVPVCLTSQITQELKEQAQHCLYQRFQQTAAALTQVSSLLECSEKDQNCKLQFPQPDYWPRHSPDFRTVFEIMIEPFSSYEIRKREVQTNKNWKFPVPKLDLERRHSNEQVHFM